MMDAWNLEGDFCKLFFSDYLAKWLLAIICNGMQEQMIEGERKDTLTAYLSATYPLWLQVSPDSPSAMVPTGLMILSSTRWP